MPRSVKVGTLVSIAMAISIYALVEHGRAARATRLLHSIPNTARAVLRIDLVALERSAAARALVDRAVPEEALSEIELTCGLHPTRDLAEVVLWVRGTDREPLESFGLLIRGKDVDAAAIAECHRDLVLARGGEVVRVQAATGPMLASRDRGSAIAIVDERTVVTGSVATVAEAMGVLRGLVPDLEEHSPIADLWTELAPESVLVAVIEPPPRWQEALGRRTGFDEGSSPFEGVVAIGFGVGGRNGGSAFLRLQATTPELAARSAKRFREWAASPPSALGPPWDRVLRSGRVVEAGHQVTLDVDISSLAPPR